MIEKLSHEAIEWFVQNDADSAPGRDDTRRWEKWWARSANRVEYFRALQLIEDVRSLPRPSKVGRRQLLKDMTAEKGDPLLSEQ